MLGSPGGSSYRRLLQNRSFVALWLGQTISFIGDYFYFLAIPILVERLTGSTLLVGLSVISSALPMLFLGPVAGVFVDRWDRKRTMIVADLLRAVLVLLCLTVRTPDQVWVYYVVGFLMSCVSRFFFPAQNAVLPLIVPDEDNLLAANGLMQIVQTAGLLIGPALAGFSIALWGGQVAFLVDSLTYLVSALAILTMAVPRTSPGHRGTVAKDGELAALWTELREGVHYLFGNRTMRGILLCLSVVQLGIGAIHVAWVPYLQRTFGLGPEGLGAVDTAQGVGMVLGGMALGFASARFRKKDLASWTILFIGGTIVLMGLSPALSLKSLIPGLGGESMMADMTVGERLLRLPLMLLMSSMLLGISLVPAQSSLMTMMQLAVPDLKRGRVGSSLNALTMAAGLISMGVAAALGEVVELRAIYVVAGLVTGVAGLVGFSVLEEPEPAYLEVPSEEPAAMARALTE
jgi:DHA3 family macrolide efflux protein-like MFS transporter